MMSHGFLRERAFSAIYTYFTPPSVAASRRVEA